MLVMRLKHRWPARNTDVFRYPRPSISPPMFPRKHRCSHRRSPTSSLRPTRQNYAYAPLFFYLFFRNPNALPPIEMKWKIAQDRKSAKLNVRSVLCVRMGAIIKKWNRRRRRNKKQKNVAATTCVRVCECVCVSVGICEEQGERVRGQ